MPLPLLEDAQFDGLIQQSLNCALTEGSAVTDQVIDRWAVVRVLARLPGYERLEHPFHIGRDATGAVGMPG